MERKKKSDENDDVENVYRKIVSEVENRPIPREYDLTDFCYNKVNEDTSETLLLLIAKLVSGGEVNKKSLSLAQCIQQHIGPHQETRRNQTSLGLALLLYHRFGSSELIRILYEHGIICSYDEVLRFRKSAACFVFKNSSDFYKKLGLTTEIGPIFSWCDNFDLWISSPNGMKTTHAMVSEYTIHPRNEHTNDDSQFGVMSLKIPRITKTEAKDLKLANKSAIKILHHKGVNKAKPPPISIHEESESDLEMLSKSSARASKRDAEYFNQTVLPKAIEFSGYNAQQDRDENRSSAPKTLFVFGPLLNYPPSHPDTVLTTMTYLTTSLQSFGMQYAHICMDMQLYMVACQIKWNDSANWEYTILHPGMMHTLMSFLGCIGTLMKGSGIETILGTTFGSVKGILNGKAWPQALRAYRMLAAALLNNFLSEGKKSSEDIDNYLKTEDIYPTRKLWVDCLIKPTFIAHQFIRAEREGDILLREKCLKDMLPYFFAAGHQHYARYISMYLVEVKSLPNQARIDLKEGCNVCRHSNGAPAVSSDQFGEQTYIKMGKGLGGLKGISTNKEQVSVWGHSFHIFTHIASSIGDMYSPEQRNEIDGQSESARKPEKRTHKEEGTNRKKLDREDRNKLLDQVQKYFNPLLDPLDKLVNIVNGKVAPNHINVHEALKIGTLQMQEFQEKLPNGFHEVIERKVKTMQQLKKHCVVQGKKIYDMESLFANLLLIGQQRNVNLQQLFEHELSAVPLSILDECGFLRKGSKSVIVTKCLGNEDKNPPVPSIIIIDGSQLVYHTRWPIPGEGNVGDLVSGMIERISKLPSDSENLIIFDVYEELSAKGHERQRRAGTGSAEYKIDFNTPLPGRDTIMKNTANKQRLYHLLCTYHYGEKTRAIAKDDCFVKHEEADTIMISYLLEAARKGNKCIRILSDDTDVFVLLVYWVWMADLKVSVQMEKWNNVVLDINETVKELGDKCRNILGVHALSGCDTVSYPFNKGKVTACNFLKGDKLTLMDKIGEENATEKELIAASTQFFLLIYKQKGTKDLNTARYNLYSKKKKTSMKSLPPTDKNLLEHTLRAHLQVILWKSADKEEPPEKTKDITKFGWNIKDGVMPVIAQQSIAPQELLDIISCGCRSR